MFILTCYMMTDKMHVYIPVFNPTPVQSFSIQLPCTSYCVYIYTAYWLCGDFCDLSATCVAWIKSHLNVGRVLLNHPHAASADITCDNVNGRKKCHIIAKLMYDNQWLIEKKWVYLIQLKNDEVHNVDRFDIRKREETVQTERRHCFWCLVVNSCWVM